MEMTKKQVIEKLNKIVRSHTAAAMKESEKVLREADMWYGDCPEYYVTKDGKPNVSDRNADQFVYDGVFDGDFNDENWLQTRTEVMKAHIEHIEQLKRFNVVSKKTQQKSKPSQKK